MAPRLPGRARGRRPLRDPQSDGQRICAGARGQLRHLLRALRRIEPGVRLYGIALLCPGRLLRDRRLHGGAARDGAGLVVMGRRGGGRRAMRAIKLNEPLAQSQGVNPLSYKLLAIALSALLAGIVGGLFVFYLTIVDPSIFDFYYTETMLIMVIIGGPGSFWGVLGSSAVLSALPDLLRFTTDLRMVLYGAVLIAAMLLFPGGVGGWLQRRRLARWRRPGAMAP